MSRPVSRAAIVGALLKKDFIAYSRDSVYLALTLVVLLAVPLVFRVLPTDVEETIALGLSPTVSQMVDESRDFLKEKGIPDAQLDRLDAADLVGVREGLLMLEFEDKEQLRDAVAGDLEVWLDGKEVILRDPDSDEKKPKDAELVRIMIGIAFPDEFIPSVMGGERGMEVTVFTYANVDEETRMAMASFMREASYQLAGLDPPVDIDYTDPEVLGEDRAGEQVSLQEKMRPLLLFMVLMMETFSLASLVSVEVLQRTVTAVLVTPARVSDFLTAKTIFGTAMSFGQALIILLLIGGITGSNWSLLLVTLLIGAVMFTGVALFVGAAGKDFMGQLFYSMLFLVPLLVPSFAVLFPGTAAAWVQALPTYPIIHVLVDATAYGATWADSWVWLAYAVAWVGILYGAGLVALKRKVESL